MSANGRGEGERRAAWRRYWERIAFRRGAWRMAFAFVVLTLAALVLIPQVVERRVAAYRAEVDAAVPARTYMMRLRYNLVREIGAMRELQLSGDPREAEVFADARAEEQAIYGELAPLLARLGPELVERYRVARAVTDRWHARVGEDWARAEARVLGRQARTQERALFESAIRSWAAVDRRSSS